MRDNERGFTLTEILIVGAMVGILTSAALPVFVGFSERAQKTTTLSELAAIRFAWIHYDVEHGDSLMEAVRDEVTLAEALGTYLFESLSEEVVFLENYYLEVPMDEDEKLMGPWIQVSPTPQADRHWAIVTKTAIYLSSEEPEAGWTPVEGVSWLSSE